MVVSSDSKIIVNSRKDPVVPVGKECRQMLSSAQYVKCRFTSGVVVYVVACHW